jgi:hypothetical protein
MKSRRVLALPTLSTAAAAVALLATSALAAPPPEIQARLKQMPFRVQTEHYVLLADVKAVRLDRYADALEKMYHEYETGFAQLLQQKKFSSSERFPVAFFAVKSDYDRFGDQYLGGQTESSIGMFLPRADMLIIHDQGSCSETCGVVFHEAFHQFMHRYIPNAPTWLDEGLATYYGYARLTDGGLSFSKPPRDRWELVRRAIAQRKFIPLWDLVSFSQADFYRLDPVQLAGYSGVDRMGLCYAEAYTLIHLLLSDPGGRDRLQAYIADLAAANGKNYDAVTRNYFGPDTCDYLTPHWIRHVNSRPEQR